MPEPTPIRRTGKRRRYPLELRLRCLRALLHPQRQPKSSFTRRVLLYSSRYGICDKSIWRWLRKYRSGGVDALRDHLRRDTLTRRPKAQPAESATAVRP
jgi:transposase-like protein